MFNIQPGQGLGFRASKEIGFGLGTPFAVVVIIIEEEEPIKHEGGMIGAIPGRWVTPTKKLELRKQILREDEEMVIILIHAVIHEVI